MLSVSRSFSPERIALGEMDNFSTALRREFISNEELMSKTENKAWLV
jgi:hypothetical protein